MKKIIRIFVICAIFLFVSIILLFSWSEVNARSINAHLENATGDIRGVTFFYLNGVNEDFHYVLDNINNSFVVNKIQQVFAGYRTAGVNYIRILIAADHYPSFIYPTPTVTLTNEVNQFILMTKTPPNNFQVEVVLVGKRSSSQYFVDPPPFTNDQIWINYWRSHIATGNIGKWLIAGDAYPCTKNHNGAYTCFGDYSSSDKLFVSPIAYNNGYYLEEMWKWYYQLYPNDLATFEVVAADGEPLNNIQLIKKEATWIKTFTPSVANTAVSLYFPLAPLSTWQQYSSASLNYINAFESVSGAKPLWIDEYGMLIGSTSSYTYTEWDQNQFYNGFLSSTTCLTAKKYPKFAWVAGNDYPYSGKFWFGLISSFTGTTPNWRSAWDPLSVYYNLINCP